jgi:hypothetical protein
MVRPGELSEFLVTPQSFNIGATTDYKFSVTSNTPMLNGDRLTFAFPLEVTFGNSPTCTVMSENLLSITCVRVGKTFEAELTFAEGRIDPQTMFGFSISNVINPASAKPS